MHGAMIKILLQHLFEGLIKFMRNCNQVSWCPSGELGHQLTTSQKLIFSAQMIDISPNLKSDCYLCRSGRCEIPIPG